MRRGDIEKLTKKQAIQMLLDLYEEYGWYEEDFEEENEHLCPGCGANDIEEQPDICAWCGFNFRDDVQ